MPSFLDLFRCVTVEQTFRFYLVKHRYQLYKPVCVIVFAGLVNRLKLIADMGTTHQMLIGRIVLGEFLVYHIAIRLNGTKKITQESLNRSFTSAVILVIVIEEVSNLLRLVHKNPHILLKVPSKTCFVTHKLDPYLCPSFIYIKNGLYFKQTFS